MREEESKIKCPRVKPDGRICGGLMEIHGWNKDTGEIRYVCTKCRYEEVIREAKKSR